MKTRIALIIPTMDLGGAEKQLCLLADGLPRDEFETHVLLLTREGPRARWLRERNVPVHLIGKRYKLDPTALFRLRRLLQQLRPQLVHTWLFAANSFGRVAARMASVPHIVASERCVDLWKSSGHFLIDRKLSGFTEAITTNSAGVRDFYVAHGIPEQLFRIIPNAIESASPPALSRSEVFQRLQIPTDRRLILSVGRLWPQKRYRDLIWAAELLATVNPDVTLVIIGDGPQRGELMRHRDALTTPDRVRFAGQRDDASELLPHADLFWIGSEYEGQSNAVLEAMRAGVPVVASDIPGNRDLVIHSETGLLVPLGDAADFARQSRHLLEHREEAERMGEAGRDRIASRFTAESMVDGHTRLYRELTARDPQ